MHLKVQHVYDVHDVSIISISPYNQLLKDMFKQTRDKSHRADMKEKSR